jgi:hypothetical protein
LWALSFHPNLEEADRMSAFFFDASESPGDYPSLKQDSIFFEKTLSFGDEFTIKL